MRSFQFYSGISAFTLFMALPQVAAAQDAADASEDQAGIADIVITANRYEENAQRSALSIEAVSSEEITRTGVSRPEDIARLATGVTIGTGANLPQIYIRGVGNYATNNYAEGAIALNIDGVYISRGWAATGIYFDLNRIEVLKGPQGTLYGRNASGGAINIITNRPRFGEFSGYVEGEIGNYDLFSVNGALNIPVSDTVALRFAGRIATRDGYLDDGYNDESSEAARAHLLFQPSSDVSLLVSAFYQHNGGKGASFTLANDNGDPWAGPTQQAWRDIILANAGPPGFLMAGALPNDAGFRDATIYGVSAELNVDLGPATLTILPAYRYGEQSDRFFVPNYEFTEDETDKQTTLEVRLSNRSDRLRWVLGGYFFDERQGNIAGRPLRFNQTGFSAADIPAFESQTRSYAVFGQFTYGLTDTFRLTGGLRYTYERKTQDGINIDFRAPATLPPNLACAPGYTLTPTPPLATTPCALAFSLAERITYNSVTWKAGFEFDVADRSLLYGNVSTGFKSGGFFAAPPPSSFGPERLLAVDFGLKNRLLDNRLQLNFELFYYDYKDHQEAYLGPTSLPGYFTLVTANAGKATSYGGMIDLLFQPTPNDRFSAGIQYNHTNYDSFLYGAPPIGVPVTGCAVGGGFVDCSGFQLVRTPTWTGNVSYDHIFELNNGGTIQAGTSVQFSSSYYTAVDFLDSQKESGFALVDADLIYTAPSGAWSVALWGRNLTDQTVFTSSFRAPFVNGNAVAGPDGMIAGSLRPPRTFGARFRINF